MTIDIDAIRKREQAADSGPWRVVEEHGRDIADEAYCRITIQTAIHYGESREIAEMVDQDHDWASKLTEENAEFIAHARQDIPALLAELDKVRAQLADTQHRAHADATNLEQILRDKTALANENARLRSQLDYLEGPPKQPGRARVTTHAERAPLYAAYKAAREWAEKNGESYTDDGIIQAAVKAYRSELVAQAKLTRSGVSR